MPGSEQAKQGADLRNLYRILNQGDAFLVLPVPRDNEPDAPPAMGVNTNQNQNNNQNNTDNVIQMNPEAVKTGAKVATAAVVGYLLWKAIEFVGSIPVCGGCAVLSPL